MPKFRITMVGMGSAVPGGYIPTYFELDNPDATIETLAAEVAAAPWFVVAPPTGKRMAINTHMIGVIEQLSEGES